MIGSHLDKEIEDLNQHINNENVLKQRKQIRLKELKSKNTKSKSMIILSESIDTISKSILKDEIVILRQIMMDIYEERRSHEKWTT